jgi:hypothetical protein
MAATIVVAVSNGAGPSITPSVTGIDLASIDNALNTLANRQANPITVGTNSFEKWIQLKITATPANYVQSFQVWFAASVDASTTLWMTGAYQTYQEGVAATSTFANADAITYTSDNKAVWDVGQYTAGQLDAYTEYLVLQLEVGADAGPGNWTQQTVNYSYDEA